jgi:predicted Zn-dependent protease
MSKPFTRRAILLVIAVSISVSVIGAQTVITAPPNKYSPSEDVQLGREAAAQAEKQLPILHDDGVSSYVQSIGRRLAGAIPPEL